MNDGSTKEFGLLERQALEQQLLTARRERDLYSGLLNLSEVEVPTEFLERALTLVVQIVGAEKGYLELSDPTCLTGEGQWSTSAGVSEDEIARVREGISRGIIAHSLAKGQVLSIPSAVLDPRFRDRSSVRRSQIEAVLCAPIGSSPPVGIVYLQGKSARGPFSEDDQRRLELFARHLTPLAQRLFERYRAETRDRTREIRKRLNATDIVGSSEPLAKMLREVELAAPLDVSLMITGETGTGKSQLARVIHKNSTRREGPFVELNCAAIPEALIESELFGAHAGAHSTATHAMEGKVAAAEGGTLFLDEIAELNERAQAKLLQLLQEKEYYPLGASRPLKANVRVMAATNADLQECINQQRFRRDLYYRLHVLPIHVPSLSERREDIQELASHFCRRATAKHGLPMIEPSPAALIELQSREWEGNVRELENFIEAAMIRAAAERAMQLEPRHLGIQPSSAEGNGPLSFQEETRHFQRALVQRVLQEVDWNIAAAARRLDLTRAHVYNLIRSFGLARERR